MSRCTAKVAPAAGALGLIHWSAQDDYMVWAPPPANLTGSFRFPRGSRIIGGTALNYGIFGWKIVVEDGVGYLVKSAGSGAVVEPRKVTFDDGVTVTGPKS